MQYDIYLLDADDTLFDFDLAEEYALKQVFRNTDILYSEDILRLYRKISEVLWEQFAEGNITKEDLQARRFGELFFELNVKMNANQMNAAYVLALGAGSYLIDGAEEICKMLAENQKRIYIVTNGVAITQKMRIGNSSINQYLTGVFLSEDAGFPKPQKNISTMCFHKYPI